jgi:hypothetical protein
MTKDMEKARNTEVFVHSDNEAITYFDLHSNGSGGWFVDTNDDAGQLDQRSSLKGLTLHPLSLKKLNTVHINPVSPHYIVIGGLDRTLKVFDSRMLKIGDEDLVVPLNEMEHRLSVMTSNAGQLCILESQGRRDLINIL